MDKLITVEELKTVNMEAYARLVELKNIIVAGGYTKIIKTRYKALVAEFLRTELPNVEVVTFEADPAKYENIKDTENVVFGDYLQNQENYSASTLVLCGSNDAEVVSAIKNSILTNDTRITFDTQNDDGTPVYMSEFIKK
jgi:hypothetical protein